MAHALNTLFELISEANSSDKRPDREIRNLVRSTGKTAYTGSLQIENASKTIAYAKTRSLRDGVTVVTTIPETTLTLEVQLESGQPTSIGESIEVTLVLNKYDGYSNTIYAHQVSPEAVSDTSPVGSPIGHTADQSPAPATASDDPLAKFQQEALALLNSDETDVISDTSNEEDQLDELQRQAAAQLAELTGNVNDQITTGSDTVIKEVEETPSEASSVTVTSNEAESLKPQSVENPSVAEQSVAAKPEVEEAPTTPSPSPTAETQTDSLDDNTDKAKDESQTEPAAEEQVQQEPWGSLDGDAPADSDATLNELLDDALSEKDEPITHQLLASIVSMQTGLPFETVKSIQHAMWLRLSTPNTFGDGKATYTFPLLGRFTVRKHEDKFNLDFASSDLGKIANATINTDVDYDTAKKSLETNSGPQIARHALALALGTASVLGVPKTHAYLTVYRSILLLLRIFGVGERRVRIEEIGEFFPSVVGGSSAYRFRAYPTFIRATSSAFADAAAFLSTPGDGQKRFEGVQTAIPTDSTKSDSEMSCLKGCLIMAGIVIGLAVLSVLGA